MDKGDITVDVVAQLIDVQFPHWAHLPITPVDVDGWDNTTFRLGDGLAVRLPSSDGYVAQVGKERQWLPILGAALPLPIPRPVAEGRPTAQFPRPWSIYEWLEGEPASSAWTLDLPRLATDLAGFLATLQAIDPSGGPPAGPHSFFRGAPLSTYDTETRRAIDALGDDIDAAAATVVWEDGCAAEWDRPAVWVHGDIAPSNLLVTEGRLSGVIDFGCSAVGDPACDLAIAWTFFDGASRRAFRRGLPLDRATWSRGRGWALWKALITLLAPGADAAARRFGWRRSAGAVVEQIVSEHRSS